MIEDEVKLATHLSRALEAEGHEVGWDRWQNGIGGSARQWNRFAFARCELPRIDSVKILNSCDRPEWHVNPDVDCRKWEPGKIAGLTGGADDYLTKPFAMNELLARVNALGRRFAAPPSRSLRAGDVTFNVEKREVCRGEQFIELSERERALLKVLMREPGRAFSRMELSERVWERAHDDDIKLIEIYIGRLRKKIDEGSTQC